MTTTTLPQGVSKVTRPTRSLLSGAPYVPAIHTNIRVLFAQIRAQQAPHENQ